MFGNKEKDCYLRLAECNVKKIDGKLMVNALVKIYLNIQARIDELLSISDEVFTFEINKDSPLHFQVYEKIKQKYTNYEDLI